MIDYLIHQLKPHAGPTTDTDLRYLHIYIHKASAPYSQSIHSINKKPRKDNLHYLAQDGVPTTTLRYLCTLSYMNIKTSWTVLAHFYITELIDKCVGSRIWVIMKGDKGKGPSPCASNFKLQTSKIHSEPISYN